MKTLTGRFCGYYDFTNKKYKQEEILEFIIRNFNYLNRDFWWDIAINQDLSPGFIIEFENYLDWELISRHQNLSEEFLIENIEKVYIVLFEFNEYIPEDVKQRIYNLKKVIDQ